MPLGKNVSVVEERLQNNITAAMAKMDVSIPLFTINGIQWTYNLDFLLFWIAIPYVASSLFLGNS